MLQHPDQFKGTPEERETYLRFFLSVCAYAYEELDTTLIPDADFDALSLRVQPELRTGMEELDGFFSSDEFDPSTGMWVRSLPESLLGAVQQAAQEWAEEVGLGNAKRLVQQDMTPEEAAQLGPMIAKLDHTQPRMALNNLCRLDDGTWRANIRSFPAGSCGRDIFHEFGAGPTPYHAVLDCFKKAGLE